MRWIEATDQDMKWFYIFKSYDFPKKVFLEYMAFSGNSCKLRCFSYLEEQTIPDRWKNKEYNAVGFVVDILHINEEPSIGEKYTGICNIEISGAIPNVKIEIKDDDQKKIIIASAKNICISSIEGICVDV